MTEQSAKLSNNEKYERLMEELGARVWQVREWIKEIDGHKFSNSTLMKLECCYLQMRLCCEVVAVALAVLHHEVKLPRELHKSSNAIGILLKLREEHADFFPIALTNVQHHGDRITYEASEKLTLGVEGLKDIYDTCNGVLHRSSPKLVLNDHSKGYSLKLTKLWVVLFTSTFESHKVWLSTGGAIISLSDFVTGGIATQHYTSDDIIQEGHDEA